ncbi:hypothetical protein AVEN_136707-1 [Araneus ventricosus]|uniref:Uncharacterized protein n=1 Tax=Araneus ventricosus TaxID=182803 RepID=A0A4Y2I1U9_ARAVE|nr:hypothetical protein AVEN_136707-1 [Araneus ventricosus]
MSIKPAIHLYTIPFHLSQDCFFFTHSSRKIRHTIHLRLQSGLPRAVVGAISLLPLFDPPIPLPTWRVSDFLASSRGLNLGRTFNLAATLARGPKLESALEVLDWEFVGIPSI